MRPHVPAEKKRSRWVGVLTLLLVCGVLFWVFRDAMPDILKSLRCVPAWGVVLLLLMGFLYEGLAAAACWLLLRGKRRDIPFSAAWRVTCLGVFANVSTLAAGTLPMQSCYLLPWGIDAGSGLGIMGSVYVLHKSAVLLYATGMLLWGGRWLRKSIGGVSRYIWIGYGISAGIILFLTLLYTWKRVLRLVCALLDKLPYSGKWRERKAAWRGALTELNAEAGKVLLCPANSVRGIALELLKLFVLYAIPYVSLRLLGVQSLRFWQVQLLSSVMLLVTSALPNIAGVGPTEFAFLLLYSGCVGDVTAASALMLYRVATYFAPFLYSSLVFLRERRNFIKG